MKQILLFSLIVFNFIALQTAQAANGLTITRWSTHHSHIDPYGAEGQRITSFQDELKKLQFHTLSSYTIIFFSRTCGYLREGEIFRPRCYEVRDAKGKLVAFIITNPTIPYQVERSILHVAADIDEQGRKVLHKLGYSEFFVAGSGRMS